MMGVIAPTQQLHSAGFPEGSMYQQGHVSHVAAACVPIATVLSGQL